MIIKINDIDQSNVKIVGIQNIPVGQTIGVWITIEPIGKKMQVYVSGTHG